jgi:hypothetical protein
MLHNIWLVANKSADPIALCLMGCSCGACGRAEPEEKLMLCDGCDAAYHTQCLKPALSQVRVLLVYVDVVSVNC